MKKLIGMTDFVIEAEKIVTLKCWAFGTFYLNTIDHAKFLQQTPTLGMFVPTDKEGNVLEKPIWRSRYLAGASPFMNIDEILTCQQYQQAEQRVIFDGWEFLKKSEGGTTLINEEHGLIWFYYDGNIQFKGELIKTIEDLVPYNLILK